LFVLWGNKHTRPGEIHSPGGHDQEIKTKGDILRGRGRPKTYSLPEKTVDTEQGRLVNLAVSRGLDEKERKRAGDDS